MLCLGFQPAARTWINTIHMESNAVEGAGGFTSYTGNSLSIYEDMKKIRVIG